jgi:hypothetical protein
VGAGAAEGIQKKHNLDQVVIHRGAAGLEKEYILVADDFINHDVDFTIRQFTGSRLAQGDIEVGGNFLSELGMSGAAEDAKGVAVFHGVSLLAKWHISLIVTDSGSYIGKLVRFRATYNFVDRRAGGLMISGYEAAIQ